ncbi:MAG: SusC/RagA family TonB-linked outer membrane protein [Janthinobacterium lividum]
MHLKKVQKVIYFVFCCLFSLPVLAQTKVVTGKVTDAKDNSPLIGVSVVAAGSATGTATDVSGNFRITVPTSATAIIFTYIGYTRKQVAITGAPLNITMDAAGNSLNEVLVVGYGTVRKRDATGAVQKVTSSDFVQGVTTNPLQQLQGKASGVTISTSTGDPNANPTVRIRGTASLSGASDPLYVIDGVIGADIRSVSPNDIESFDILKDASAAAIYGSRAGGGVILVTTKTGKAGKPIITVNAYTATESPEHLLNFADRSQYLAAYQSFYGKAMPAGTSTTSDQGANTNWFKEITHTGISHNENVGISGGTDKGHYRGSLTYYDQQGIVLTSYRKDINARFNLDQKALNDKLLITLNVSGSHTNSSSPPTAPDGGSVLLDAASVPSVISPYNVVPTAYDVNNPYNYQLITNTQEANPLGQLRYVTNTAQADRLTGALRLDYSLTKEITISPYANAIRTSGSNLIYYPPTPLVSPIQDFNGYTPTLTGNGDVDLGTNTSNNITYGATAGYRGVIGKSRLNALLGAEHFSNYYTGLRVGAHDFSGINLPNQSINSANAISIKDVNSFDQGFDLYSAFGRIEYNYADKYYITANGRYDQSTKLGINNQGQFFPSGSIAWNIGSEDFMKDISWLSSLKLRGGVGQVGNQDAISPYASQTLFGPSGALYYNGATGTYNASPFVVQNPNTSLRWEVSTTTDVATDFSLFAGRLSGSLDFYYKKTNHLLYNYTVPVGSTYFVNNILANIGSMENKGVEFNLNGKIITNDKFTWNAGINFGLNRNKILNLSGELNNTDFNVTQTNVGTTGGTGISASISQIGYYKVGYPVGTLLLPEYAGQDAKGNQLFWKYATNGTRTATSDISTLNLADDGSTQDRKFYSTQAKFTYSISNSFTYGGFDLSLFLRGSYGGKGFNEPYMDYTSLQKVGTYAILADALKYNITSSSQPSTYWLQSTSFLKVQSANLGYTFKITENNYISNLHIYVAGNNLYTFTPYKGLDPELNTGGGYTQNLIGIDSRNQLYPRPRQISFGIGLTLK